MKLKYFIIFLVFYFAILLGTQLWLVHHGKLSKKLRPTPIGLKQQVMGTGREDGKEMWEQQRWPNYFEYREGELTKRQVVGEIMMLDEPADKVAKLESMLGKQKEVPGPPPLYKYLRFRWGFGK
ncbi:Protein of unknown function [Pyronema omphalodes CBS 100304]|uniref:Uncharacterized protein n=1 Tax=Pyronema omphalodes (strain CBS 100304) TaxID=1076935 RepID=U4KZW2_PYROM|nr:Protein of unknown function [Pyronema omphalodes CBS 100304]